MRFFEWCWLRLRCWLTIIWKQNYSNQSMCVWVFRTWTATVPKFCHFHFRYGQVSNQRRIWRTRSRSWLMLRRTRQTRKKFALRRSCLEQRRGCKIFRRKVRTLHRLSNRSQKWKKKLISTRPWMLNVSSQSQFRFLDFKQTQNSKANHHVRRCWQRTFKQRLNKFHLQMVWSECRQWPKHYATKDWWLLSPKRKTPVTKERRTLWNLVLTWWSEIFQVWCWRFLCQSVSVLWV